MRVADFDYFLPEELIAQKPVYPRDISRLMVVDRKKGTIEHRIFKEVVGYLHPGDVLVLNNTRVLPARLFGIKKDSGARIEVVLLKRLSMSRWEALVKPGKRVKPGTTIIFGDGELTAETVTMTESGGRILHFSYQGVFEDILHRLGKMPLPPYIKSELDDQERYQTVYASREGSAAAPTAGLHFTTELLDKISSSGVQICHVLLHVGLGTFRPVKVSEIEEHKMHAEYYEIEEKSANIIQNAVAEGRRVIAVGTTSVRTLETVMQEHGKIIPTSGWTDIFIYPGYEFKVVNGLITNFHLPKSTLLMLVSAFLGKDLTMKAYETAVKEKYRFFSFGDAMLIL
ncbi:tRNA preQ1(34) S-adenosylmethionine ribosyltransferase-isomerase QueA [Zhaonella formicivorans]|uniref:tRNA preQ1(34) S-adenosylmethionine ribosyltransferase-isomerase QueA n=1 Tax=Zhaonella formicivorans TaxID=2528593 RepID=UPI0010D582BC|nr:tRNA preQ1(34) S-adenosylmethionine ribosyltransferase-isomerase QueA [Zhaonella formicivorans]